jgi:hypothetical protein
MEKCTADIHGAEYLLARPHVFATRNPADSIVLVRTMCYYDTPDLVWHNGQGTGQERKF